MPLALAFVATLIAIISWLRSRGKIPSHTESGFPILSTAMQYAQHPVETIKKATQIHGNVFSVRLFTVYNVWLRGNKLNKTYLETKEDVWSFGGGMGIFLDKILDPGYWIHLRGLVGSLSRYINRSRALDHVAKVTLEESDKSFTDWTSKEQVDLFESSSYLVHKIIIRTLMGEDFYENSCQELYELLHSMEGDIGSFLSFVLPSWVPHPPARRLEKARQEVKDIFMRRLEDRERDAETWSKAEDYITYTLNDSTTKGLKVVLPSHHTLLMFAAHTSTVASMSWTIISLLRHPEMLKAVQKELRELPEAKDPVLLQACIRETSRFYSGMNMLRLARRDHVIPNTTTVVSAGSVVSISPYLTHHDPENFPDPERWWPQRWIGDEGQILGVDNKAGVKFMPFGAGSHRCVGEKMAGIVVTRAVGELLREYDVEWAGGRTPHGDFKDLDFARIGTPWLKWRANVTLKKVSG